MKRFRANFFICGAALERQSVKAGDVSYVICSDGRVENIGNLNLFPDAIHVVGSNIMKKDTSIMHQFREVCTIW